ERAVAQPTPRLPAVRRLPDAAARRAEVEDERLAGIADDRVDAAAAERTDLAPAQAREPARIRSCRGGWGRSRGRRRAATGWPLRGGRGSDENGKHNKDRTTAHRISSAKVNGGGSMIRGRGEAASGPARRAARRAARQDRKSTRLNSSHEWTS